MGEKSMMMSETKLIALIIALSIILKLTPYGNKPDDMHVYTVDDLYAYGLTEQDEIYIMPTKGSSSIVEATVCTATDLQNYLRIIDALTQGESVTDIEPHSFSDIYRRLEFAGSLVESYIAAEIDGKSYVQRPDGVICTLDEAEYKFMLDFCSVVIPYPENLDPLELLGPVEDALANMLPKLRLPDNANFQLAEVRTVDDFYITDSPSSLFSDVEPPTGQYTVIIPCGDYYELQLGIVKDDKLWRVTDVRVARANLISISYHVNGNWRVVNYGPTVDDPESWGVSQTHRVELYDYNTGEILWQMNNVCVINGGGWTDDGRYLAISHEVGRAENRGVRTELIDTSDMTSITLLPPDGEASSRLQAINWISDTELRMYYGVIVYKNGVRDLESSEIVYNLVTGEMS